MVLQWWRVRGAVLLLAILAGGGGAFASNVEWRRASTPELTIITPLPEKSAIARANEFSQYIAALRRYFGETGATPVPLTLVVFADPNEFHEYRPLDTRGKPTEVAGFFVRQQSWAIVGVTDDVTDEARRSIFHEGVHWFLHDSGEWMPPWLDEGLAEVFSSFEIVGNDVRWGRALKGRIRLLYENDAISLRKLMLTTRGELFSEDRLSTRLFYAQSWAFVHYLMFGRNQTPRDATKHYVAMITGGVDMDLAFERAFGEKYSEMDLRLREYINGGRYFTRRMPLVPVPPVRVERASREDVDEALGRLALVGNRLDSALRHARAIVTRKPADPRGHALLGLCLKTQHRDTAAIAEFEQAIKHGSRDFQPYFEVAYTLQKEGTELGAVMAHDAARRAADLYLEAIRLFPSSEQAYQNLAGLVGAAEPMRESDRTTLEAGARLFPENALIQLGLAQLAWCGGDAARAHTLLADVLSPGRTLSNNANAYARRIQNAWMDQDLFEKVNRLTKAQEYLQALALLERRTEEPMDAAMRAHVVSLRREIKAAEATQRLNTALQHQDWTVSRRVIGEILESDAPAPAKSEARRILAQIDASTRANVADNTKPSRLDLNSRQ